MVSLHLVLFTETVPVLQQLLSFLSLVRELEESWIGKQTDSRNL